MTDAQTPEPVFHPIQEHRKIGSIPESVALKAYEVYCALYGAQPALVNVEKGCRGGFGTGELIAFLYARTFPREQWRQRFEEGSLRASPNWTG